MRTISAQAITDTVARLCIEANTRLPKDVEAALAKARAEEPWPLAKNTLDLLWSNLSAAKEENLPICQDTGMACVFVELGTDVHIDGHFEEAIHEGVRRGYTDGYLRKSIVADPLRRGNTGDNTPAAITVHLVDGISRPASSSVMPQRPMASRAISMASARSSPSVLISRSGTKTTYPRSAGVRMIG